MFFFLNKKATRPGPGPVLSLRLVPGSKKGTGTNCQSNVDATPDMASATEVYPPDLA